MWRNGRRNGLKIRWGAIPVWVRVPPPVPLLIFSGYDSKAPGFTQNVTRNVTRYVTFSPVIPRCFSTFFESGSIRWTPQVPPEPIASGNTSWSRSVSTLYRHPERSLSRAPVLLRQLRSLVRKRNRC